MRRSNHSEVQESRRSRLRGAGMGHQYRGGQEVVIEGRREARQWECPKVVS
jgi:hypothetical protein